MRQIGQAWGYFVIRRATPISRTRQSPMQVFRELQQELNSLKAQQDVATAVSAQLDAEAQLKKSAAQVETTRAGLPFAHWGGCDY